MRKVVTVFALWCTAGSLFVSPVHAATRPPASAVTAGTGTIGGTRLAGHGYVRDKSVAEPPHIEASSYVVADLETGNVLAAKDPHGHYRPASTLKTLTAITLIPRLDPRQKVRPSLNAVNASGSAVGLDTKMSYSVDQLFHGLLMQSGNDAAIALSEAYGGLPRTLAAMNAEARRIQARDTVARTPNGLDDDPPLTLQEQHSSAYDLALIMKQGLTLPDFRKYVAARTYHWPAPPTKEERKKGHTTGGWEIGTHDHLLLGDRYPGMIGGKNGWTSHAMGSFVGAATRDGHTIIISLMHAQSDFWPDARALLDWGFAERAKAAPVGVLVNPIPPPAKPAAKAALRKPAASVRTDPTGDDLRWWEIGLPAGAVAAVIAGLVVGLRRRRHPAGPAGPEGPEGAYAPPPGDGPPVGASPPPVPYDGPGDPAPESGPGADERPSTGRTPPPDVKVAGAPPAPGEPARPASWETTPNPVGDAGTPPRSWTVRLPGESASERTPPADGPATGEDARGPFEPAGEEPSGDGQRTVRDEPYGDEAAHS